MMSVNAVAGIAIPVALAWWMVARKGARLSTILTAAGTFIVFALVLEAIVHQVVLKGPHGSAILGNTLYYALYGGLAAGIFEEAGRFVAMRFLMKKEPTAALPGVAYGIGHGGAEMMLIFGITMISNLVISILINISQPDTLFSQVPGEAGAQLEAQIAQLENFNIGSGLIGLWERVSALVLQLGLSMMVWTAVRKGGRWLWLLPAAILLHALVDGVAVMLMKSVGMVYLELIITALAVAVGAIGFMLAKRL